MTIRNAIIGTVLFITVLFAWSWWREGRPTTTPEQAVAKEQTRAAEAKAAQVETGFVAAKAVAASARKDFRPVHDTVLKHLTDTLLVKGALAKADTVIRLDSVALAAADSVIAAQKDVTAKVRNELVLALRPQRQPRITGNIAALYDPLSATPSASVTGALRVIGGWSLVARGDQRFAIGEKPRLGLGVQIGF